MHDNYTIINYHCNVLSFLLFSIKNKLNIKIRDISLLETIMLYDVSMLICYKLITYYEKYKTSINFIRDARNRYNKYNIVWNEKNNTNKNQLKG